MIINSYRITHTHTSGVCGKCTCGFVGVSIDQDISETKWPNLPIFVYGDCGHGSVRLRRCCDKLCTSSFMDDVMFSYNRANGCMTLYQQEYCCNVCAS